MFTTHTPVAAGFDLFSPALLERYLGPLVKNAGLSFPDFVKMGRMDPENQGDAFNMAVMAMENAAHMNGVSELHAKVSQHMFQGRWPEYPAEETPIDAVTNGIHTMTWVSWAMADLFDHFLGEDWRRNPGEPEAWAGVESTDRVSALPTHSSSAPNAAVSRCSTLSRMPA